MTLLDNLNELVAANGMQLRGGFYPEAADAVPDLEDGVPCRSLVLVGQAGSHIWPAFSGSSEFADGKPNPLDRWSERIGRSIARETAGLALFPFGGPPFHPFIRWAERAEGLRSSRLGMLLHEQFGLWHAYRFAIAFAEPIDGLTASQTSNHACDTCADQPCLSTCPVNAFDGNNYNVMTCYQYLKNHPDASCHTSGCQARGACPQGADYRYTDEHAAFHMQQFYRALDARHRKAN